MKVTYLTQHKYINQNYKTFASNLNIQNHITEMSTGLGLSALPRDKAWIICRNYLQGAWTNLDKHEMILKQVT